jgi:hypothetical protein
MSYSTFATVRRKNLAYNNVFGAHRNPEFPSHEDTPSDRAVYARQSFSTPETKSYYENLSGRHMHGIINYNTGKESNMINSEPKPLINKNYEETGVDLRTAKNKPKTYEAQFASVKSEMYSEASTGLFIMLLLAIFAFIIVISRN